MVAWRGKWAEWMRRCKRWLVLRVISISTSKPSRSSNDSSRVLGILELVFEGGAESGKLELG